MLQKEMIYSSMPIVPTTMVCTDDQYSVRHVVYAQHKTKIHVLNKNNSK